jgi:hypothetical protein
MAAQAQFCGRCGAPLAYGATFCGRCGTPVNIAAVAPYPVYAYPQAPPRVAPRLGGGRTTQIAVAGGLISILLIAVVIVSAFALRGVVGTHPTCTANCSPKIVHPLSASATFTSSAWKFQVDYSASWNVRSQDANGITLGTQIGSVSVIGSRSGQPLDQVIQGVVSALPSATWQNVAQVSSLKGAHIGDQDGLGALYAANLVGANSTATKVRFAVVAATKGGVTVVMFAVDPSDVEHFPSGMAEGQIFDYMCTEFRWE